MCEGYSWFHLNNGQPRGLIQMTERLPKSSACRHMEKLSHGRTSDLSSQGFSAEHHRIDPGDNTSAGGLLAGGGVLAFWPGHISLRSRGGLCAPLWWLWQSKWPHATPSPESPRNNSQCFDTRNLGSQDTDRVPSTPLRSGQAERLKQGRCSS